MSTQESTSVLPKPILQTSDLKQWLGDAVHDTDESTSSETSSSTSDEDYKQYKADPKCCDAFTISVIFCTMLLSCLVVLIMFGTGILDIPNVGIDFKSRRLDFEQAIKSLNSSYFEQWPGSTLVDKEFRIGPHSRCGIPSLFFVWNHKTGGYFKEWLSVLKKECGVPLIKISSQTWDEGVRTTATLALTHRTANRAVDVHNFMNDKRHHMLKDTYQRSHRGSPKPHCSGGSFNWSQCLQSKQRLISKKWAESTGRTNSAKEKLHSKDIVLFEIRECDSVSLRAVTNVFSQHRPSLDSVVIFMVRKPLNVVLSGYNYHASGEEKVWTNRPILQPELNRAREGGRKSLRDCFRNIWHPKKYVISKETTMFLEYKKGFVQNYRDKDALQNGLYLELTRFTNCEWPLHIAMYREITENPDKYPWSLLVRFEWFHKYDYQQSIVYVLQQIGDVSGHRERLSRIKQRLDDQAPDRLCSTAHPGCANRHMTRGKYNEELQTDLLLKYDEKICPLLKNMTLSMSGKWTGLSKYC